MDENERTAEIENCRACGNSMDVTSFAPFTEVQCPECHKNVHVKTDVGGYEIVAKQGVGGMSLVFKAVDKTLGRKVAIKLLNESYSSDAKRIEEFEKEAKITAAISHPNVVRVFTVGQAYGRYFIAMELVDGESLEQRLAVSGKLDEEAVTRLAIEVVEGLKSAHQAGLIHRDMKPGNILLDTNGRAKIVDFGLALVTSGGKALAEEIWATPYYVPPETLRLHEEDLRSDMYALAASLYHALTGEPPFTADTTSTSELLKIKASVPKLANKADGVSKYMCAIIDKAMAFEASERFQSYEELLDVLKQLDAFYRTGVIPEPIEKKSKQPTRRRRRKKLPVVPIAVGAMGVIAAVGYFTRPDTVEVEPEVEIFDVSAEDSTSDKEQALRVFIATELKVAQNLFKEQEYQAAHQRYLKLALTDEVPVETAFWAGLQSASSAWLNADSRSAREALSKVAAKIRKDDGSTQEWVVVLENLGGLEAVKIPSNLSASLEASILFASALKEWNQGRWELAHQSFDSLKSNEASEMYTREVKQYLADYRLLEKYPEGLFAITTAELDQVMVELNEVEHLVKTPGRATFNIAQWKLQVEAEKRKIEEEKKRESLDKKVAKEEARKSWIEAKDAAEKFVAQYFFKNASRSLSKVDPPNQKQKEWAEAMVFFSSNAGELYDTTAEIFAEKSGSFVVVNKFGGRIFDKVLGAEKNGLLVSFEDQDPTRLGWSKLAPQSMWELHKLFPNSKIPEELRYDRMVQLACYTYLTGLREESQLAVNKICESEDDFAEKWHKYVAVLEAGKEN
ncbi:serine/threonine-protein kinase [Rubritalea spongiae]|uniref:Serine/threonine-protein kinase n=1 Tax=Rubritalea spongiae TaxID=430797 RepID=A0ABW5E3H5_9BACT